MFQLWDVARQEVVAGLPQGIWDESQADFSNDSKRLVLAEQNGPIHVFGLLRPAKGNSNQAPITVKEYSAIATKLKAHAPRFSPDARGWLFLTAAIQRSRFSIWRPDK